MTCRRVRERESLHPHRFGKKQQNMTLRDICDVCADFIECIQDRKLHDISSQKLRNDIYNPFSSFYSDCLKFLQKRSLSSRCYRHAIMLPL